MITEKTLWADLPNAKHINRVIASARQNPEKWDVAQDAVLDAAWDTARNAVRNAERDAAYYEVWGTVRNAVRNAERDVVSIAARAAVLALVAYDDCAYLLGQKPDQVKLLAGLGVESAILLLPAVIALNNKA